MTNPPRKSGTAAETAVVRFLRSHGFPGAERRALAGTKDVGDILITAGLIAEVKRRKARPSANQIRLWVAETLREQEHAGAAHAVLIVNEYRRPVSEWLVFTPLPGGLVRHMWLGDWVQVMRERWGDA